MIIRNIGEAVIHILCKITDRETETLDTMIKAYREKNHEIDNFEDGYKERFKGFIKTRKMRKVLKSPPISFNFNNNYDRHTILKYVIQILYNDDFVYDGDYCVGCLGYGLLLDFIKSLYCDLDCLDENLDNIVHYFDDEEDEEDFMRRESFNFNFLTFRKPVLTPKEPSLLRLRL